MVLIRDAVEDDAQAISEVFHACYGEDYRYAKFYDTQFLKRLIFSEDAITLVAEDEKTARIVGTSSVILESGAYSDLVGEFGRLAVHPEARRQGIGRLLMEGRLSRIQDRLHVAIVDSRVVHPFSTKIAVAHGFSPVGFLPERACMSDRENIALLVQHFGRALALRRNNPRIIPEAYQLAHIAMENCGLEFDAIVDEESAPYPYKDDFSVKELSTEGYAGLLRIERGRVSHREIFGSMRLHYGFFKLRSKNSYYLIAREGNHLAGAIGFTHDEADKVLKIFELIAPNDDVVRYLIKQVAERYEKAWGIVSIEADISAYAPRMQRTFLELGFSPVAYIPALVFHQVERLDIVRMTQLFAPLTRQEDPLIDEVREVADIVIKNFVSKEIHPKLLNALDQVRAFSGLTKEQQRRVASYCTLRTISEGARIFSEGNLSDAIYLVLEGRAEVYSKSQNTTLGTVSAGGCLGEASILSTLSHSASARGATRIEAAVLRRVDLEQLIRRRPDIGVVLFRNLAIGLGEKLLAADLALLGKS